MTAPLQIRGYFHMWPGNPELGIVGHNAGSETTLHACMRAMVNRGHSVKVLADQSTISYAVDGIEVERVPRRNQQAWIKDWAGDCDILTTHLDCTRPAMRLHLDIQKPLVHWVHNDMQLRFHNVTPNKAQLLIFNSKWIAEKPEQWEYGQKPSLWPGPSIVLHPVVEPDRYRCETGNRITLVNPTPGKGAATFYALARALPDREFLAVKSVYGEQIMPPSDVRNVKVMDHTPDIREAFQQTRILLMPSEYESYGRVAVEAACCGIPTIAHPTPGLVESLGSAGIFHDRNNIPAWQAEIEHLLTDEGYYNDRSAAALVLADSLDPESEFDRLEEALVGTAAKWKAGRGESVKKIWVSDKRYWLTSDGQAFPYKTDKSISLLIGVGGELDERDAIKYGLYTPPEPETKMVTAAETENKMEIPRENKSKKRVAA